MAITRLCALLCSNWTSLYAALLGRFLPLSWLKRRRNCCERANKKVLVLLSLQQLRIFECAETDLTQGSAKR